MIPNLVNAWLGWLGEAPCFSIYGKAVSEPVWRVIDVYATPRRDQASRLPMWRGTCTTWSDRVIAIGWDFAGGVLEEQRVNPASRERPVVVVGGRVRVMPIRWAAGATDAASYSEIMAHECGHTWQALRLGSAFLPLVGSVTRFREGPYPWNRFENEASEVGQFGGIVAGSVCPRLAEHSDIDREISRFPV